LAHPAGHSQIVFVTGRRFSCVFTAILAVFLVSRLWILLNAAEVVSNFEELFRGAVTQEILSGLQFPLWDYQADSYHGGSLVAGLIAVPFFKAFGPTLLSFKLASLICFSLPSLFLFMLFLRRNFGAASGLWGGAFFAAAPPTALANSLYNMGFHSDSILFSLLILFFLYEYLFHGLRPKWLWAAAFISGFGIWYTYITAISALSGFLAAWVLQRRVFLRHIPGIIAFFLLGFSPWIAYNLTHTGGGIDFLSGAFLTGENPIRILLSAGKKFFDLWIRWFPVSLGFTNLAFLPSQLLNYGGFFLISVCVLSFMEFARTDRMLHNKLLPLLLYPLVFWILYSLAPGLSIPVSKSFSECRYFVPLIYYWLLLMAAAAPYSMLMRRLAAAFLMLCVIGNTALFAAHRHYGKAADYKGYSYYRLLEARGDLVSKIPRELPEFQKWFDRYAPSPRFYFSWGLLQSYPFGAEAWTAEKIQTVSKGISGPFRLVWLEALGFHLAERKIPVREIVALASALPEADRPYLVNGYALHYPVTEVTAWIEKELPQVPEALAAPFYFWAGMMVHDPADPVWPIPRNLLEKIPAAQRPWFYRGLGAAFSSNAIWDPAHFVDEWAKAFIHIPEAYRQDFNWGTGWGIRREVSEDRKRAEDWVRRFPEEAQAAAFDALRFFDEFYKIELHL
jgi:hypothetical protein